MAMGSFHFAVAGKQLGRATEMVREGEAGHGV